MTAYPQHFQQQVQTNLRYWYDWLPRHQNNLARLEQERDSLLRAVHFALKLPDIWAMTVEVIIKFSPYIERWGYWDSWRLLLEHTVAAAQQLGDVACQIQILMLLGRLSARQVNPLNTVGYYRQTIHLARRHNDPLTAARACSNLGFHYIEHDHWQRAEVLCCYALKLFEQMNNDHGLAHTHNHLGLLRTRQQQWSEAQRHLEQACAIWQTMGDQHSLIAGYLNLGVLFIDRRNYDQALAYLDQVQLLARETGEKIWPGFGYANQGRVYLETRSFAQSEECYRQAEHILETYGNFRELARVWNGLGLLYQQQGRVAEGRHFQKQALKVWQELKAEFEEVDVLLDMGEAALAQNDLAEAQTQLQAVEQIVGQPALRTKYRFLQPRMDAFRRQLKLLSNLPGR